MTTIGDLTPNMIGRDRIIIQHDGSTVSGLLAGLDIDTTSVYDNALTGYATRYVRVAGVTVTLGSVIIGPLDCSHTVEVIA